MHTRSLILRPYIRLARPSVAGPFEAAARRHPGKSGFASLGGNREAFTSRPGDR